ncbi:MAG: hypothetical protein N3G78_09295 [Desulfobacterota bacterium]|nr:hypothetical protein [Thermodesulfobacteriota bacterium]
MALRESKYRSDLGFYKEFDQDRVVLPVKEDGGLYYVEIPSHLRNRLELVVGSRLKGWLEKVQPRKGKAQTLKRKIDWEIVGYWHELHIPQDLVRKLKLKDGDQLTLKFERVVNYGNEIEI